MRLRDILSLAAHNLRESPLRTALCALSVAVGSGALLLILSIGLYGQKQVDAGLQTLGVSGLSVYTESGHAGTILSAALANEIEQGVDGIRTLMPIKAQSGTVRVGHTTEHAVFLGTDERLGEVMQLEVLAGALPNAWQSANAEPVAVVGDDLAQTLYGRTNITGRQIRLKVNGTDRYFTVCGVVRAQTGAFGGMLSAVAPHLVYVPETHFSAERFLHDVEQEMAKHKAVIVAVSEGVSVPEGVQSGLVDNFGHKYLSGIGKYLEQLVRDTFGCKVRSVELNVMQRCSSHLSSKTDIDEAEQIGAAGVQCALRGETGRVMIFRRIHNKPYTVVMEPADASQIANREKFLPREFLTPAGNNISDEAMSYFLPLIQGELNLMMRGGIPMHFTIQESVLK